MGATAELHLPSPVVANLAALPQTEVVSVVPDALLPPPEISLQREWDTHDGAAEGKTATISWWDGGRWSAVEREQERWRREWLREARQNPENVPVELWPRIVEWAPYDRSLERSARSALRNAPSSSRRYTRIDLDDSSDRVRRWARDMLRRLQESEPRRRSRRPSRPPGG